MIAALILLLAITISLCGAGEGNTATPSSSVEQRLYNDLVSFIPDTIMDNNMKKSLRDVLLTAERIINRVDKPLTHPMAVNIAILRLYAIQNKSIISTPYNHPEGIENYNITPSFRAQALHYFKYAVESYFANPKLIQEDIVLNNLKETESSSVKVPRHMICLDHLTKSIVVSVRGTASLSDMITDLYIEADPFLEPSRGLFAMHGMAESAEALLPTVTQTIQRLQKSATAGSGSGSGTETYRDYRVVITGHSLGAGTACLLALLLSTKSKIPVVVFAYAPPPVVSSPQPLANNAERWFAKLTPSYNNKVQQMQRGVRNMFARFTGRDDDRTGSSRSSSSSGGGTGGGDAACVIHSFVHSQDIISRASHTEILRVLGALVAIDNLKWNGLERGLIILRGSLTGEEMANVTLALAHRPHLIDGTDKELYIPGTIYHLNPIQVELPSADFPAYPPMDSAAGRVGTAGTDPRDPPVLTHTAGDTKDKNVDSTLRTTNVDSTSGIETTENPADSAIETVRDCDIVGTTANSDTNSDTCSTRRASSPDKDPTTGISEYDNQAAVLVDVNGDITSTPLNSTHDKRDSHDNNDDDDDDDDDDDKNNDNTASPPPVAPLTDPLAAWFSFTFAPPSLTAAWNTELNDNNVSDITVINKTVELRYNIKKITNPNALFNGIFYHGDNMVNDHLTDIWEKALMLVGNY